MCERRRHHPESRKLSGLTMRKVGDTLITSHVVVECDARDQITVVIDGQPVTLSPVEDLKRTAPDA